ncbi:hypothetical protein GCM10023190_02550 [Enteractinococcus fodinae]|uniref:Small-conductance mechanosensitive channel n=1 Tax=Enteractinococcus fodinae TaxID=684663 RepID=A0ABU2B0Y1_9MICC|nr:DUF3093 domain-containing protein [Enteractinococcus fodinae]MDR7347267.1 small-conductance mechanosensitive channel [Enteractinococcus fodinae]
MTENADKRTGPGGSSIIYHETLRPTWSMWLLVIIAAVLGWLTLAPLSTGWGIASGILVAAVAVFALLASRSDITVTSTHLQVGRATIEREHVGEVTGYVGDAAFQQRGQKLHGLAYLHLRSWIKPVVRIQIEDRQDRTPYWLTSTARPEELVAVLGGTMHVEDQSEDLHEEDIPQWLIDAERAQLEAERADEQQK